LPRSTTNPTAINQQIANGKWPKQAVQQRLKFFCQGLHAVPIRTNGSTVSFFSFFSGAGRVFLHARLEQSPQWNNAKRGKYGVVHYYCENCPPPFSRGWIPIGRGGEGDVSIDIGRERVIWKMENLARCFTDDGGCGLFVLDLFLGMGE
jgi:hypothetical protein